ncbi:hypothetical protein ACNPQK_08280 [Acinetobacter guillouiae]|uniref:hypothetical protein n=1 Tax=Acinetobacter guillouiae TaxID=106649 RepID=UPI003AF44786
MENKELEILKAEIERFKVECLKTHVVKVWAESYTNSDPFGYVIWEKENNKVWWMKTQAHQLWEMWLAAKTPPKGFILLPTENVEFFSHDFNGDGFKYHDTLEEAKKEAEASLDYYRDRVADGHHVESDGEFNELCFGIVIGSADYSVDDVVTKEHHSNGDYTQYEIGTEILSLSLNEKLIAEMEQNHD